jgi:hypothetical protein
MVSRLMLRQTIDFEWQRDPQKRFEVVPERQTANPNKGKEGAGLLTDTESELITEGARIVWVGDEGLETYRPLESRKVLERFVAIQSDEDALEFVKRYGFLREGEWRRREAQLSPLRERAAILSEIASIRRSRGAAAVSGLYEIETTITLRLARAGVRYSAPDLDAALLQRFILDLAGGIVLRVCELPSCHEIFTAGPGHRRADSKFCSEDHQVKAKNLKAAQRSKRKR